MSINPRRNKCLKKTNKTVQEREVIKIVQTKGIQEREIIGKQRGSTDASIASRKQEKEERTLGIEETTEENRYNIFCLQKMLNLCFSTPLGFGWLLNKCRRIRYPAYQLCVFLYVKVEKLQFWRSIKNNFMVGSGSPQHEGV